MAQITNQDFARIKAWTRQGMRERSFTIESNRQGDRARLWDVESLQLISWEHGMSLPTRTELMAKLNEQLGEVA